MTYRELQTALEGLGASVGAAEAHGWLCGALCARAGFGPADWVRELAEDVEGGAEAPRSAASLERVHGDTLDSLCSPDFGFEPMLPGDDSALEERVAALAALH